MGTLISWTSGLGGVLAGLPGAIFGAVAGGALDTLLPDVGANILGELGAEGVTVLVGQLAQRMAGPDAPLVNHDLQRVFRHAVMLSLEDIGGPTTFATSARSPRLAPDPAVVYPFAAHDDPELQDQIRHMLREVWRAIDENRLLPIQPVDEQSSANVQTHLLTATPHDLAHALVDEVVEPFLADQFGTLLPQVPEVIPHLHEHLHPRAMLHFAELIKDPNESKAWRAFQRLLLETLHDQVRTLPSEVASIKQAQQQLLDQLATLQPQLATPDAPWLRLQTELLAASARSTQRQDEGFRALFQRLMAQDAHLRDQFERLHTTAAQTLANTEAIKGDTTAIREGVTAIQTVLNAPHRSSIPGAGVFQVPYPPNPHFRGRDTELATLAAVLLGEAGGTAAVLPAVSGTGGIGKTQLVSEFAHAHRDQFPGGVFWLNMADGATVNSQVAAAGGPGGLDLLGWSGMDVKDKVAAVQKEWNQAVRRLLVFDNLEEPALLKGVRPTSGGARVLITTRRGKWAAHSGVRPVPLQTLARPESVRLLLTPRYGDHVEAVLADPATTHAADAICEQVGDLPLALALAGAYLDQTRSISLVGYGKRLAAMLLAHPSLNAELEEGLPTQHAASVAATIALSYERLERAKPSDALALALLQRMAQLAPAPVPQRLLVRLVERDPDDEDQCAEVDAVLHGLSALGVVELLDAGAATMHRLVAAFVRDQDTEVAAHTNQSAAGLIREVYEIGNAGYPQRGHPYLVHLQAFATSKDRLDADLHAMLLNNLGMLLKSQCDLERARPSLECALDIREQALGPTHPATATSLNNLGLLLHDLGDLAGAKPYLERALAIHEQTLGLDHLTTAMSLNNLAGLLRDLGDLAGARPYLERALTIHEQTLGLDHPDTALMHNNLGMMLQTQGDLADACPYLERALAIWEQVMGPDHPITAQSLNNLGMLLHAQGDVAGARPHLERALAIRQQALGPAHSDTAQSLNNLGHLLHAHGDIAGARLYFERALAIYEHTLGSDHPTTAVSLNNLGSQLQAQGDLLGAQPCYERALAIYEQSLGPTHPDIALSLNNLGSLLYAQGDVVGARPYLERALAILTARLGPNHPDTQTVQRNLAALDGAA